MSGEQRGRVRGGSIGSRGLLSKASETLQQLNEVENDQLLRLEKLKVEFELCSHQVRGLWHVVLTFYGSMLSFALSLLLVQFAKEIESLETKAKRDWEAWQIEKKRLEAEVYVTKLWLLHALFPDSPGAYIA